MIQEKYGIAREAAQKQVEEWNAAAREADAQEKRDFERRKAS
jgi:hypothetical protein